MMGYSGKRTIFIGLIIIVAGLLFYVRQARHIVVETTRPVERTVVDLVIASGTLRPVVKSDLGAEVSGTVEQVLVREGDPIRQDQVLVTLKNEMVRLRLEQALSARETARAELSLVQRGALPAEVDRARADLKRARLERQKAEMDLERQDRLLSQNIISLSKWEDAKISVDQARLSEEIASSNLQLLLDQPYAEDVRVARSRLQEAEDSVKTAQAEFDKHIIRAPFDGILITRHVEPGNAVTVGSTLLSVADTTRMEIYIETDENNMHKVRPDQQATVLAPAYRERPFQARVAQIGPEVDHNRGVVGVRLAPLTLPDYIRPDMTVDVNIETARFSALTLPISSVLNQDGTSMVLVVQEGEAVYHAVEILSSGPDWVAVEGIGDDMDVIVRATEITVGQKVRPKALS